MRTREDDAAAGMSQPVVATNTFRPSMAAYEGTVGGPVLIGGALCGAVIVVLAVVRPIWLLAAAPFTVAGATAAICSGVVVAYIRFARVTVTPDRVTSVGFFSRRRSIVRSAIGSTTFLGRDSTGTELGGGRTITYDIGSLYIADTTGAQFLKLNTGFWPAATLSALDDAIDAPRRQEKPTGYKGDAVNVSRFARARHEHPFRTALLMGVGAVGIFALAAVAAAVVVAVS